MRKKKRAFCLSLIIFSLLLAALLTVSTFIAMGQKNHAASETARCEITGGLLDSKATAALYKGIQIADASQFTNRNLDIINFDVSDSGSILVAYTNNRIAVYDEDYRFLSGFIITNGSNYYVQWNEDDVQILFVRGSLCLEVSSQGAVKRGIKVNPSRAGLFDDLKNKDTVSTKDGFTFRVERGKNPLSVISGNHYIKLIKTGPDGSETILYDVTSASILRAIAFILIGAFFYSAVVLVGIYHSDQVDK